MRSDFKRSLWNPHSCILHLPCTKTHHHGQDVVLVDQLAAINPISLLKRHLRVNKVPDNTHIFAYASSDGWSSLTKSVFLHCCNTIWQALGYPRTTGHCFRIGGTTELLIAGTPPDVMRAMGVGPLTRSCVTGGHWRTSPLNISDTFILLTVKIDAYSHPPSGVSRWRAIDWAAAIGG
jgi:hypothetical protein